MSENERFTFSDVWGWRIDGFLNVMNGLDRKNNELKERIKELEKENKQLKMTEKYYVVHYYQENGFASTEYVIKTFKDLKKAKSYAKFMNKEDKDAMYFVYEREFDDGDVEMTTKDCFHCYYAQSNEDGIHCYRKTRTKVKGTDTCEHYKK